MFSENFNDTHPELKEDERFFMNMMPSETEDDFKDNPHFDKLRFGRTAYTHQGEKLNDFTPIFILKDS